MPTSRSTAPAALDNDGVATRLEAGADLLEQQGANPFRVGAYRRAAQKVRRLDRPLAEVLSQGGRGALVELPTIGHGIAAAVVEMLRTGRWSLLDRLQGDAEPESLLQSVPGIGPALAHRIYETLHVDSLEALETAAHDGRLEQVVGIGPRRAAAVRSYLAYRLGGGLTRRRRPSDDGPGIAVLLDVDREYREAAERGRLPTIAPRRFNPQRRRWLSIGHFERAGWHLSALFSNTARAHQLGRTKDWVILYFYDDDHREGQYTVVTETRGPLSGLRVVRGREEECRDYYESADRAWSHTREIDLEKAKRNPGAVFESPEELAAHPDLSIEQKIDLLRRWQYDASEIAVAEEEGMIQRGERRDSALLRRVAKTLDELTGGFDVERTPPTKQGGGG